MNYNTPGKKSEELIKRLDALDEKVDKFIAIYAAKYEEMYKRLSETIQAQRDEIVRLSRNLEIERTKHHNRIVKAIGRFKSE